jgi:serine/threonine protein kinase
MAALPTHIGRYEIKSLIGRGGMGDLYLAFDPNTNRLVALKLLNATLDSDELRQRFAREARALAALNHTNIVNIYDTGEFEDSPFIVMEYVRGETLAEMIKRKAALTVSQKLKLMAELCAGLAQAHEAGIIHRDIKPANLMVDQQGRLKILDFGIARVAEGGRTRVGLPLTQVNMLIGTPGYMSPEQIEGGEVDHRSDIFAVGAVCYELLAYDEAFAGTNTRQIESGVLRGQPVPLASRVPGLDPEIDEIVLRALKRDPNKRYQDAATFEAALERLRSHLGPDAPGPPRRPTPPPPPQTAKGKSREARAEAAYQRALVAHKGGAIESARRFAVEALAEDPSHVAARALLARLQTRAPVLQTVQSVPTLGPVPPTVVGTAAGGTRTNTAMSTNASASTRASSASTMASAPTIIISPTVAREPAPWKRFQRLWRSDAPSKTRGKPRAKRDGTNWKRLEDLWIRYRWATVAVALLLVLVAVAGVAMLVGPWLVRPSAQLLTITKPTGGTISAAGITCGTRGANCSTTRPKGDPIELTPEADAGFTFAGYTGDCAPGGRTVMTVPRTCGANFVPGIEKPVAPTQVFTIAPVPTGGTIEGVDIICGTKGSICSANYPEGVPVEFHPTPDPGFTFMGYLGDCAPVGQTQMAGPRTCGATFSPTAEVSKVPTLPLGVARGSRGGRGEVASAQPNGRGVVPGQPTTEAPARGAAPSTTPGPTGPSNPSTTPSAPQSSRGTVVPPVQEPTKPVAPPPTDEEFAKGQIQEVLKAFCAGFEALDAGAVKAVWPKGDVDVLQRQLKQYKSAECKFADPKFVTLDAKGGKAKVEADLKRGYMLDGTSKIENYEQIATMTLSRPEPRGRWYIDTPTYKPKPK